MIFKLLYTPTANNQIDLIENDPALADIAKADGKTLGLIETNLRYPITL